MSERGFALIENLVAIVLLGMVATGAFGLYSTGFKAALLAQKLEQASFLAQQRLEQVKAAANCGGPILSQSRRPVDPDDFPGFTWEVDAQGTAPGLQRVSVAVYWSMLSQERSVTLTTYVRTRRGEP